jgi:hypothetical protein
MDSYPLDAEELKSSGYPECVLISRAIPTASLSVGLCPCVAAPSKLKEALLPAGCFTTDLLTGVFKRGICMRSMFKQSVSVAAILAASAAFSVSAIAQTAATGNAAVPSKAGTERQPQAAPAAQDKGAATQPAMPAQSMGTAPAAGSGTAIPSKAGSERQPTAVDGSMNKPSMKGMSAEEKKAARAERKAERKAKRPTDAGTTMERKAEGTK